MSTSAISILNNVVGGGASVATLLCRRAQTGRPNTPAAAAAQAVACNHRLGLADVTDEHSRLVGAGRTDI